MKYFFVAILVSSVLGCTASNEEANSQLETIETPTADSLNLDSLISEFDSVLTKAMKPFKSSSFSWLLTERTQENEALVTDVAVLVDTYPVDTIYFWTARGKWYEVNRPEDIFEDFPVPNSITIYSENESCFFTIQKETLERSVVLFGGLENDKAYAVVTQGTIWIRENEVTSDIFIPEEVETYTDYSTEL